MRRWIGFFLLAVSLMVSPLATVRGQNNSLADALDYAKNTGTLVLVGKGNSTFAYNGFGHYQGFADAMMVRGGCRGIWATPNFSGGTVETNGMAFMRRRSNLSLPEGPMWAADFGLPGYPVSVRSLGIQAPIIGYESPQTTTLNGDITNSATSLVVGDASAILDPNSGFTAYFKIDDEIISYNNATGTTVGGGVVRGVFSVPAAHTSGATIRRIQLWGGPVSTYLGETTLASALTLNVTPATIDLVDGSFLPRTNVRIRVGTEQINATVRTGNTLSGTITRAVGGGAQPAQSIGARVMQGMESPVAALIRPEHPLGVNTEFKVAAFWKSLSASSITETTIQTEAYTQATAVNTDNSFTPLGSGTVTNMTGTALGTIGRVIQTIAQPSIDRGTVSLNIGTARDTFGQDGPWGPSVVMGVGGFAGSRATGVIQYPGISEGGKTLNDLHRELNVWKSGQSVNEFQLGTVERNKIIKQFGDAALGGNGNVALLHMCDFGHNEVGDGGYGGPYIPAYPWTERPGVSTLIDGGATANATTIDVLNASGLATQGMIYCEGQYIWYRTRTSTQLQDCVWGVFGSTPADLVANDVVFQGYPTTHPLGFASEVLFDYLWEKARWIDASGTEATFFYVYQRPMPTSDSPTYGDLFSSAAASDATREGRLREFAAEITAKLGSLPGFIVLDPSRVYTAAQIINGDYGASSGDNVHHTAGAYRVFHQGMTEYYTVGAGSGRTRGGLRGRPRRGVRGKKRVGGISNLKFQR